MIKNLKLFYQKMVLNMQFKSNDVSFIDHIVSTHEELCVAIKVAEDNIQHVYGNLGKTYLSMMQRDIEPENFFSAFKMILSGLESCMNDIKELQIVVTTNGPKIPVFNNLAFTNPQWFRNYINVCYDTFDKCCCEMKEYIPEMEKLINGKNSQN